jgi:hypothetical protein
MENNDIMERLEAATSLLERTVGLLESQQNTGNVAKISATVEAAAATRREADLAEKLEAAEREIAALKASAQASGAQSVLNPLRRTVPASTSEMLAKHGIGDGPVDIKTLDAALAGLSLEQRIAVKSQLLRAGAIA